MRNQRQSRASSMYSQSSTQSYQMNSSKAMINQFPQRKMQQSALNKPISKQQVGLQKSNLKQSSQFPKIMNMDGKTADDSYVEKLHNHISFLNDNVKRLKTEQTDYKSQMMNMMHPQNDKQVVDHAITTQNKFKDMKQKLIQEVHQLQYNNVQIISDLLALKSQKEYLEKQLEESHLSLELQTKYNRENLEKSKQKQVGARERREEKDFLLSDLQAQLSNVQKEYNELKSKQEEKQILQKFDLQIEEKQEQIEDDILEEKKLYLKSLQETIDKFNQEQSTDQQYIKGLESQKELKQQYEILQEDLAKVQFELDERMELIKYAQRRKDESVIEFQNDKTELQKYQEVKEQIDQRNEKRIKDYLQKHKGKELIQKQRELDIIKKKSNEYKMNQERLEKQLREETLFINKKQNQLNKLTDDIEKMQAQLDKTTAQINSVQTRYDGRMPDLMEQYERYQIQKDEKYQLQNEQLQQEEKHTYLQSLMNTLQERVNLEEEMRKVQVEQLKNITYDNQQLNQNINNFYNNWGTMSQVGRSQLFQQQQQ